MTRRLEQPKPADFVFINCPFTEDYRLILEAIVFTICDCGFAPRCALETIDDGEVRLEKIFRLIKECRFGIHDISCVELDPSSKLPRFNMAFEMGLFLGAKRYGRMNKSCLILDSHRYRYLTCISDLRGHDVSFRGNKDVDVIAPVRHWLANHSGRTLPGPAAIRKKYKAFVSKKPVLCKKMKWNVKELKYNDYLLLTHGWLKAP